MKVKISYNIELDDVPGHVAELVDNVAERFKDLSARTNSTAMKIKANQFSASILTSTIGNLREELEKIDTMLADFGAILLGYEQAKISPELLKVEEQESQEEENAE